MERKRFKHTDVQIYCFRRVKNFSKELQCKPLPPCIIGDIRGIINDEDGVDFIVQSHPDDDDILGDDTTNDTHVMKKHIIFKHSGSEEQDCYEYNSSHFDDKGNVL